MSKLKARQKLRNYLATIGWSTDELEAMLVTPTRQGVDALEDLLVESGQARKALKDCRTHFPNAKILGVKPI